MHFEATGWEEILLSVPVSSKGLGRTTAPEFFSSYDFFPNCLPSKPENEKGEREGPEVLELPGSPPAYEPWGWIPRDWIEFNTGA